jgi:thiol-disulfide isomerase/thioredoxin
MNARLHSLAAALFAALASAPVLALAAPPASGAPAPTAGGAATRAATPDDPLAGMALDGLSPEVHKLLVEYAKGDYCYCGCPHTVASCLLSHHDCKHAQRMVWLAAGIATRAGATVEDVRKFVDHYYSSFDHRAKLDTKAFGPPLGDEKAKVTLVEFSDFTCPFCQAFRPVLEAFVAAHPGRVRLYFKPFPIESHPGAIDAAVAGEWARDQGAFWPAHDAFFSTSGHDLDSLAGAADLLKLDASDLRDAVTSRRLLPRVRASQEEGRVSGVRGTPTLFMNGRLLELPDHNATWLEFTLEDEEEWLENKGQWAKD